MLKGTLKWYNRQKGFGFIIPEDGSGDVFFHKSVIVNMSSIQRIVQSYQTPIEINYTLDTTKERPCARTVMAG